MEHLGEWQQRVEIMMEIDNEDGEERINRGRISTSMMGLLEFL